MNEPQRGEIKRGSRIRIIAGTFENFEAVVAAVDEASGKISAEIWIFGRCTPVELEPSQVEKIRWQ